MAYLNGRPFMQKLASEIARQMPSGYEGLHSEAHGHLLKLWYGEEKPVHYEVALHQQSQLIEIGLHCEAAGDYNELIRRGMAWEVFEIKHRLGYRVELEPWDRGWVRVYETHPLMPLDEPRLDQLAERCALFITRIQPIYEEIVATLPVFQPRLNTIGKF